MNHIVCCTDDKYAPYCGTMLFSLLSNSVGRYCIHIFIETLTSNSINNLTTIVSSFNSDMQFHKIDISKLNDVKFRNENPLSKAAYYRILLASTLECTIDKVLYLDCDMVVLKDISYLFELNIEGYALAAIKDVKRLPRNIEHRCQLSLAYGDDYFNSGLLIANLKYWREHNAESQLIEFAKRSRFVYFHDQDALNYVFKKTWFRLPPQCCFLNNCPYELLDFCSKYDLEQYIKERKIIHYASIEKPWYDIFSPNKKYFLEYYKLTPWKDIPLLKFKSSLKIAYLGMLITCIKNKIYVSPKILKILVDLFLYVFCLVSFGRYKYIRLR
ncbi:glycosyltransferase family 8 protein [Phocaeicola sartorii]|uniref:Glycosyltransferase family 8 protein n=1 Tax=Phocaeicola sartorii TaxID=671267 RepID=A0A4S2FDS9_9BACT|nr:glycosyltransferase family 8 protein [Phocaeicola sartorii]TGY67495.1 glycosyltransferase family 8 protein [Phocaeicola sartorii]